MAHRLSENWVFNYPAAEKQVLLLTCMDLRLLDDTVEFMQANNLTNRYDQVVFAGAALGVLKGRSPDMKDGSSVWLEVFLHHLRTAINDLRREIKDIYILEHRQCGAYKLFHPKKKYYDDPREEERDHREQANKLKKRIAAVCKSEATAWTEANPGAKPEDNPWKGITTRGFLMDLRGQVKHLG